MAQQRVTRAGHQRFDDKSVEAAGDDGEAALRGGEIAFDGFHGATFLWPGRAGHFTALRATSLGAAVRIGWGKAGRA